MEPQGAGAVSVTITTAEDKNKIFVWCPEVMQYKVVGLEGGGPQDPPTALPKARGAVLGTVRLEPVVGPVVEALWKILNLVQSRQVSYNLRLDSQPRSHA